MKPAVWLILLSTASLSGCASNPFSASAPMHVPEALYQPAFYSVGNGLSPAPSGKGVSRRNVHLSQLMAEASLPVAPARKTVSARDRKKALVFYGSGLNAAYSGRYSGALYLLRQSYKFNPNSAKTLSALAQVSMKLGDTAGADRYLKSALHLNPLDPKLQLQAAALDLSHGRGKAALQRLLIARKSPQLKADSPLLPRIDFLLGAALQSRGYYGAAAEAYQQTALLLKQPSVTYQFNSHDHRLMRSRGLIHFLIGRNSLLAGRYPTAAACFATARRLSTLRSNRRTSVSVGCRPKKSAVIAESACGGSRWAASARVTHLIASSRRPVQTASTINFCTVEIFAGCSLQSRASVRRAVRV